jgi:sterol desaturase/sphingolipid hydroxylase (fatty acid hydroxylase superfamily)
VNGWLWNFHFQHHREEHFDIWLSTHTHALEVVVSTIVIAATAGMLGFAPVVTEIYVALYTVVKVYQHSAREYSLGPLDLLVVGPSYHRLHHAPGSRCNYAVTLTVWDLLFRTARWPSRATRTAAVGLAESTMPFGFWSEMTLFLRRRR